MKALWKALFSRAAAAIASVVLLVSAVAWAGPLEAGMAAHMLVHIPMILFSGMLAHRAGRLARPSRNDADTRRNPPVHPMAQRRDGRGTAGRIGYDELGIAGLLWASFVAAYWMLPRSLDQVLVSDVAQSGKFAMLWATGWILAGSLGRANTVIKLFFLGNFCWMSAIAGMLYQEVPQRLCNAYLLGDQEWAGKGMVAVAIVLPVLWLYAERRKLLTYFSD
jgi:hypothetical protein